MAEYKLEVTTGNMKYAGTMDYIHATLFGTEGQSERTELDNFGFDALSGMTRTYTIKTTTSLGKVLLLKVEKDPFFILSEDEWYCSKIVVTTPEGEAILFPCYRWISRGELVELRGGKAMKVFEDDCPLLTDHRTKELTSKKRLYQWAITDEKIPHRINYRDIDELPAEVRFSLSKEHEIHSTRKLLGIELLFKGMAESTEQWESFEDIKGIFCCWKTPMSEYVAEHWKADEFFGYQFLNGTNPSVIKRCSELPPNFPVTEEMVKPFLQEGSSLKEEMKKGNIFICDQKIMDKIPTREYEGKQLQAVAGLCLFYMNPENKLMPIAIQLHQQPSEQNPIFLPSDSETDWLLAKIFVKSADAMAHQAVYHLMGTHYLAEAFAVAALRNFPVIHPLYKLLIPHFRYTLHINTLSRTILFGPKGALNTSTLGNEGMTELIRRGLSEMTYSSLCLPENITARGLESVPNFYYRDDGLKLWNIINSFVRKVVEHYYPSDNDVVKDTELQNWISEIFTHGFLKNKLAGFPTTFDTVEEVVKFITMLIFTVTAQHAALNNGQFDFVSWMPNGSLLTRRPPPTTKGQSSVETILETFPNIGETVKFAAQLVVLSEKYSDMVLLGAYTEEWFQEPDLKQMINEFQADLSNLTDIITARNSELELPYTYLSPTEIENSVTI
ncbi:hydroperoxide isomerase ALOXE3-like [Salarias fasciatus]|uniref:hydroperoxide isomerase ALOXE3-like n=1 Tax=Salarias fasciatus TaxID=181472 RepID=UPI001176B299|nr:hydroperoxide isomerase ALOXE3-like [Salarias fasciatus]